MPLTAIVLAAGRGSRLGPLTDTRPKCLLPLDGETILDRQLRILRDAGIGRVVIVTGYRAGDIAAHVAPHSGVVLHHNPDHEGAASLSSLYAARGFLNCDSVILNADVVFVRGLLDALTASNSRLTIAVSRSRAARAHAPVHLGGGRLLEAGTHLTADRWSAEFCCVACVRQGGVGRFRQALDRSAEDSLHTGWSQVFSRIAQSGGIVNAVDYEGPLFDINSPEIYEAAREFVRSEDDG